MELSSLTPGSFTYQQNFYICNLWERILQLIETIDHMLMYIIFYILHKVKMNDYDL